MFKPEDLFPIVDETAEIVGVDLDVLVLGVKYVGAIRVEESTLLAPGTESKWYAPGVGVVKVQTKGETEDERRRATHRSGEGSDRLARLPARPPADRRCPADSGGSVRTRSIWRGTA